MRLARPRPLLWTAIAAYATGFAALSVLRHRAFETGRFDLGNMVQAVWSTAHGHPLQVTTLRGAEMSRLGSHVDPILVVFAPLWWVWPHPSLLLTTQAFAVALGALPLFWLARKHTGRHRAGMDARARHESVDLCGFNCRHDGSRENRRAVSHWPGDGNHSGDFTLAGSRTENQIPPRIKSGAGFFLKML